MKRASSSTSTSLADLDRQDRSHRLFKKRLADHVVTEHDLDAPALLINLVNELDGPAVEWDEQRNCYGLKARQHYKRGALVTTYGGAQSVTEISGDYVAKGGVYVDGRIGFKLSQKGRWINESDRERTTINVTLGLNVRAAQDIAQGEWLFADYGPDYQRTY